MARTFKERALQAILSGGRSETFWQKTIPASSGTVGHCNHLYQYAGTPPAGTYPAVALTATAVVGGASPSPTNVIVLEPPESNEQALLTYCDAKSPVTNLSGTLIVCDLLAYYQGFSASDPNPQLCLGTPNPGDLILPRYTDGEGVMIIVDIQTTLGATPAVLTVTYTDQNDLTGTTTAVSMLTGGVQGKLSYAYAGVEAGKVFCQ